MSETHEARLRTAAVLTKAVADAYTDQLGRRSVKHDDVAALLAPDGPKWRTLKGTSKITASFSPPPSSATPRSWPW